MVVIVLDGHWDKDVNGVSLEAICSEIRIQDMDYPDQRGSSDHRTAKMWSDWRWDNKVTVDLCVEMFSRCQTTYSRTNVFLTDTGV